MAFKNLVEFHIDHDNQHSLNAVISQDPSCPKCHPLEKQSAEFGQFLGWYRKRQSIMTFSQRSVEVFDRYLDNLNKQRGTDGALPKDQIKDLSEQARLIVKAFRYRGRPTTRSAELGFYITKLVEKIGFDKR